VQGASALICSEPSALFELGRVVATPGALTLLEKHPLNASDLLRRHQSGDWGDVPAEDRQQNNAAARSGERVLSSYPAGTDERIWIITEWDRSVTTLLLPSEY
jgi:hypothetical protein